MCHKLTKIFTYITTCHESHHCMLTHVVVQGFFDHSLISYFFNILHINAFINDLQKLYFIYLLYFTIKFGITGTIILKLKVKIN